MRQRHTFGNGYVTQIDSCPIGGVSTGRNKLCVCVSSPNPAAWGVPLARFAGGNGSNIDSYFRDNIVFDTTFCGDWTGNPSVWDSNVMCLACIRAPMCVIYGS